MRRLTRSVLICFTVALTGLSLVLTAAGPADASAKAPTCTGFGYFHSRTVHPLIDNHSETRGLVPAMDKLICSAADYSTIDIKSWFIRVEDSTTRRIIAHLALMHRYHHVHVNVHVGRNAYPPYVSAHYQSYAGLQRSFPFAHVYSCLSSCWRVHEGNISHSKWITVSRLRRQADPAVLTTSTNWSHQQFALTKQTGMLTIGHPAFYRAFAARYAVFVDCATHHRCNRPLPKAQWVGSPGAWVYFAPATADPIADLLARVRCTPGSHIDVTSLLLTRPTVLRALAVVRGSGCGVRVIVEHPITAALQSALRPRCEAIHDKSMVILTSNMRVVVAGSEDFGGGGLHGNDNVMVMTSDTSTLGSYEAFFNYNWSRGGGCQVQG